MNETIKTTSVVMSQHINTAVQLALRKYDNVNDEEFFKYVEAVTKKLDAINRRCVR